MPSGDDTVVQWVLIVGYTAQYFIMKNSLGTARGSSGYLYLEKGKDLLGINDRAYALQSGLPSNGTCSFADGSCVEVSENSCSALGSNFGRLGSICPIPCASATTAIERAPALSIAATAAFLLVCLMLGYRRLRPSRATV